MTPYFFYISDITNSSSFNGKILRKKSMLENFRANVLKYASDENGVRRGNVYLVKIGEKPVEDGSQDICKDKESNVGPVAGY